MPCPHAHGEHNEDYRHCTDCGMEWTRIGADWFVIDGWLSIDMKFLTPAKEANRE